MIGKIIELLNGLPKEAITTIIAALPVVELRLAIPVAYMKFGMPISKILVFSYIGNMLPVIPLLILLEPVSERLRHFHVWRRFCDWLFERTKKRAEIVQRYEAIGLMLLVAIPLPATGAWTGCIAASLFKIKFRYAFPAILAGVIIAGIIVTSLTLMGIMIYDVSFVQ